MMIARRYAILAELFFPIFLPRINLLKLLLPLFKLKKIISAFSLRFDNRRLKELLKGLYSFVSSPVFILHLHVFNVPPSFATNSKQKIILASFNRKRQLFFYWIVQYLNQTMTWDLARKTLNAASIYHSIIYSLLMWIPRRVSIFFPRK